MQFLERKEELNSGNMCLGRHMHDAWDTHTRGVLNLSFIMKGWDSKASIINRLCGLKHAGASPCLSSLICGMGSWKRILRARLVRDEVWKMIQ